MFMESALPEGVTLPSGSSIIIVAAVNRDASCSSMRRLPPNYHEVGIFSNDWQR